MTSHVQPPLLERELVDLFKGTMSSQYYERILGSVSSRFYDLVIIGERIKDGMKSGKIQGEFGGEANTKKFSNFNSKKKDGDTNVIMGPQQSPLT